MPFDFFNLCILAGTGQARRGPPAARAHPPRGKQQRPRRIRAGPASWGDETSPTTASLRGSRLASARCHIMIWWVQNVANMVCRGTVGYCTYGNPSFCDSVSATTALFARSHAPATSLHGASITSMTKPLLRGHRRDGDNQTAMEVRRAHQASAGSKGSISSTKSSLALAASIIIAVMA